MHNDEQLKSSLGDGFIRQNVVLMSGLVTAPVIVAATTFQKGFVISVAFLLISFITIFLGAFIPRKIVYTVRIIIYALLAAIVYIPVYLLLDFLWHETIISIGIYIQIITANSLILSKTESRFYLRSKSHMMIDVLVFCLGFSFVSMSAGLIREFLAFNTLFGFEIPLELKIPSAEAPFFGFILIGIGGAVCRYLYSKSRET